jgi:SAM-dependent methyltransferase
MLRCPLCASQSALPLYEAKDIPVLVNKIFSSREQALKAQRGDIDLWRCAKCGLAWNSAYEPKLAVYDGTYDNSLASSQRFVTHMRSQAEAIAATVGGEDAIDYFEIGCGQGQFMSLVAQALGSKLTSAQGMDPAWRGNGVNDPIAGSRVNRVAFDSSSVALLDPKPNIVVARHCIEYFPSPELFLADIRSTMAEGRRGYLFIETASFDSPWNAYTPLDIVYERCSIYGLATLERALATEGFDHIRIERVFGGQHLWATARRGEHTTGTVPANDIAPANVAAPLERLVTAWRYKVAELQQRGPVAVWGAGARGVMFCNFTDPDARNITAVIDSNPAKQKSFVSVTGHPIVSPDAMESLGIAAVIVTNESYRTEIEASIRSLGLNVGVTVLPREA